MRASAATPGFAPAACRLFDELEAERVTPQRWIAALRTWAPDSRLRGRPRPPLRRLPRAARSAGAPRRDACTRPPRWTPSWSSPLVGARRPSSSTASTTSARCSSTRSAPSRPATPRSPSRSRSSPAGTRSPTAARRWPTSPRSRPTTSSSTPTPTTTPPSRARPSTTSSAGCSRRPPRAAAPRPRANRPRSQASRGSSSTTPARSACAASPGVAPRAWRRATPSSSSRAGASGPRWSSSRPRPRG